MSDYPMYRVDDTDPMMAGKSLRDRFKMVGSLLWARGLPAPTADEFGDAAAKVLVKVEPVGTVKVVQDTEWVEQWWPPRPDNLAEGRYYLIPVEATDE